MKLREWDKADLFDQLITVAWSAYKDLDFVDEDDRTHIENQDLF